MIKKIVLNTWFIISVTALICGLTVLAVLLRYQDRVERQYHNQYMQLDIEVKDIVDEYDLFSKYIYDSLINEEDVLKLMDEANTINTNDQNNARNDLYQLLIDEYIKLTEFHIEQIHFYLPDNTSFLNMNDAGTFGDNVTNIKETVKRTNESLIPSKGFEEGSTVNGFRYVYPLVYEQVHVGSVEIVLPMTFIIDQLTKIHKNSDYYVIFDKNIIDDQLYPEQENNYIVSYFSNDFYFDTNRLESIQRNLFTIDTLETYYENQDDLDLSEHKHQHITLEGNDDYDLILSPLKNFDGEFVGYIIVIEHKGDLIHMRQSNIFSIVLIIGLYTAAAIITLLVIKNQNKMIRLSEIDKLTQINNRHKFDLKLDEEIKKSNLKNDTFAVIMFDIDDFKKVNDTYGHLIGDQVLSKIAKIAKSYIRKEDTFARFGGEEFVIILPKTTKGLALERAESIRKHVKNETFEGIEKLTVSLGVTIYRNGMSAIELLDQVDKALYEAKKAGRNNSFII